MTSFNKCVLFNFLVIAAAHSNLAGREENSHVFSPSFNTQDCQHHIQSLCDEHFAGRSSFDPKILEVAGYVRDHFQRIGLAPWPKVESFEHRFVVTQSHGPTPNSHLTFGNQSLTSDHTNMVIMQGSASGQFQAPLVFGGYGIDDHQRQDFESLDLKNKFVMVLRYGPFHDDSEKALYHGDHLSEITFTKKVSNAVSAGAQGIFFVNPPNEHAKEASLATMIGQKADIPCLFISQSWACQLMGIDENTFKQWKTQADQAHIVQAQSQHLLSLDITMKEKKFPNANVLGYLEGKDPQLKEELIIVGGHMDHVGLGFSGRSRAEKEDLGKIHPGADDNASGTTMVLELAEYFAHLPLEDRPARSLVFVTFAAEEIGLFGAKKILEDSLFKTDKIQMVLNFDMVGRYQADTFKIYGTESVQVLENIVTRICERHDLEHQFSPGSSFPSDSYIFHRAGIPSMGFFTGIHDDYHRPSDTIDKVNLPGMVRLLQCAADIIGESAKAPRFEFKTKDQPGD